MWANCKPTKCKLGCSEVECLGHIVSEKWLRPNEDKIKDIKNTPRPKTKKQVRSFLGLVGFYRKFIKDFSQIANPLTELTKKNKPKIVDEWSKNQQNAFDTLKERITEAPILRPPNFKRKFILQTDASDIGVGAILLQEFEDGKFPIA